MIDISAVGNTKGCNKDNISNDLYSYLSIARKIVAAIASSYRGGLAEELLNNDDAMSNIATQVMIADGKFNGTGTLYGYRKQCVIYAIKTYLTKKKKDKLNEMWSLNHINPDTGKEFSVLLADKKGLTPEATSIQSENSELLDSLLNSGVLTTHERECIELHYLDGRPYADISREKDVSRQAIKQTVQAGIYKLSLYVKE